jgi:hypothetical protein
MVRPPTLGIRLRKSYPPLESTESLKQFFEQIDSKRGLTQFCQFLSTTS